MNVVVSLAFVGGLFLLGLLGAVPGLGWIFGVILPYIAIALFLGGLAYKVLSWAKVPVPFRIPTTCGQQKTLPWIKQDKLENPHNFITAAGRMALEILLFRSLLRNTKSKLMDEGRLVYGTDLTLWLAAMAMHWSLLFILVRHLRFMVNPVPGFVTFFESVDGFLRVGLPVFFATTVVFIVALAYLLYRRLSNAQLRYISLIGDYVPLFLLLGIGISGFSLRHLTKTDIPAIKELFLGLTHFSPTAPDIVSSGRTSSPGLSIGSSR